jgi:hypothetical protein
MINKKRVILKKNISIKNAIKFLEKNKQGIILFANRNDQLLGTITDGDFRRYLLKNKNLENPIKKIINKKYKFVNENCDPKTIKEIMLKNNIESLPVLNKEKKILDLVFEKKIKNIISLKNFIIYFVGGKGLRARPLTCKIPKPMLKVKGRPMLERLVIKARNEGFKNLYFITNYRSFVIKKYFSNGKKLGVNIFYAKEKKPLGTCGGLRLLEKKVSGPLIVSNGDVITEVSYKKILEHHIKKKNDITISVKQAAIQNPFGVVTIKKNKVKNIDEKPISITSVCAGVNVINSNLLSLIKENSYLDMNNFIKILIKNKYKVGAFGIYEEWKDFGTLKQLELYN